MNLEHRVPPPIVGACSAVLMLGAAWVVPFLTLEVGWTARVALLIAVPGAVLDGVALIHFLRAHTTINPLKPASASTLVTVLLLAWAIYLSNAAALALLPLFILYMNRFQIAPEERALEARFGAEYIAYRARVRRWL